jgi:two-component system, cell cycle response regulator
LIDLDNFKEVNDTYWHLGGDTVLREMAKALASSVRPYDFVGRYGGEEFLIIAPRCDSDCLLHQAERLRSKVSTTPVRYLEGEINVTASFGCTVSRSRSTGEAEAIQREADAALYCAKNEGRNRVVIDGSKLVSDSYLAAR